MKHRRLVPVLLLVLLLVLLALPAWAGADPQAAVRTLLAQQVAAWNRGDLEGYMAGYWRSPDLRFYGGGTITSGWQQTLDRYRKRYQSGPQQMGTLSFSGVEVQVLCANAALARGRWVLALPGPGGRMQRAGLFTVLLRLMPEGWRIVHDHSSAE